MRQSRHHRRLLIAAALAVARRLLDEVADRARVDAVPITPKVPPPVTTFGVTVTANPNHLTIGSTTGSTITVRAANVQDGSLPPGPHAGDAVHHAG